jgi:hypothetical protein
MIAHSEVIMSRIRRMLRRAVAARDVTDTGDIFSVMLSRIDSLAVDGRLRAATDAAVWTQVLMTCKHLVLEKARVADRLRRLAAAYGDHLLLIAAEVDDSASDDDASGRILGLLRSLGTDADRESLILKLNDVPDRSIGESLGIGEDAVRQRWSRLCRGLRMRRSR